MIDTNILIYALLVLASIAEITVMILVIADRSKPERYKVRRNARSLFLSPSMKGDSLRGDQPHRKVIPNYKKTLEHWKNPDKGR